MGGPRSSGKGAPHFPRFTAERSASLRWAYHLRINDPAAGSPTATLLRLLLPPVVRYWHNLPFPPWRHPRAATERVLVSLGLYLSTIGSNDGRCVQVAGTNSARAVDSRLLGIPRSWQIVSITNPHHDAGSEGFPPLSRQEPFVIRPSSPFPSP